MTGDGRTSGRSGEQAATLVAAGFVGCKVSQADAEEALAGLAAAGLEPVVSRDAADVVVVHTCCVTAEAERKSRRLVRRAASAGKRVVVAGCAAALRPEQFEGERVTVAARPDWARLADDLTRAAAASAFDHVGGDDVRAGVGALDGAIEGTADGAGKGSHPQTTSPPASRTGVRTRVAGFTDTEGPRATPGARTRLALKVQDGCAGSCTYCVVRLVRGEPRSTSLAAALEAARAGLERGCGEVVLSGIDLGAWRDEGAGGDRSAGGAAGRGARLPELVAAVAALDGLKRVRLSSIEPRHVTPVLVELLAHPRVARHLHVPLQSADDGVLRAMKRPYTFEEYLRAVEGLRDLPGGAMLSTDVIVGYPVEDEAAFSRTLEALESGLFGRAHVFAYSPRPGTAAAELSPLPAEVVKERMARALAAAEAAALAARRAALGREADVLVEERRDGLWRGYSSEYIRYALRGSALPGELVTTVADGLAGDGVTGAVVGVAERSRDDGAAGRGAPNGRDGAAGGDAPKE
ncbi:MAG TPA: radical SAM protein [Thermoleophilia bacterium]|nr:radical SAM protein [Thermoleophilia bacterium]